VDAAEAAAATRAVTVAAAVGNMRVMSETLVEALEIRLLLSQHRPLSWTRLEQLCCVSVVLLATKGLHEAVPAAPAQKAAVTMLLDRSHRQHSCPLCQPWGLAPVTVEARRQQL